MPGLTETELVNQTLRGDRHAFGQLVEKHQTLVCSVAYSVVGDFARSEDIAQEAFLTAWTRIKELRDPASFVGWIRGIARNLALMSLRRDRKVAPLDADLSVASVETSPPDLAVQREEEQLVWQVLESMPEQYRLPLVLYYREQNSVAKVAEELELTEDATKQRLSRGREMLRQEIATTIERTLRRTVPKVTFVVAVLGSLPGIGAATATAATLSSIGKESGSLAATPTELATGAMTGSAIGMLGALLGIWVGDQSTRFPRERALFRRTMTINLFCLFVVFPFPLALMQFGWWNPIQTFGPIGYGLALIGWMALFTIGTWLLFWWLFRTMKQVTAEEIAAGSTPLPHSRLQKFASQHEGRHWTSHWRFLGMPLVDIQFHSPSATSLEHLQPAPPKFARGWIALGDRACGAIAMGGIAVGGIAIGGVGIGGITFGGLGLGLVSLSGCSVGLVSIGGLALGFIAAGGMALGWLAFGGAAIAWRAAKGGLAIARDYALGGAAMAAHANDAVAKKYFEDSSLFRHLEPAMMNAAKFMNTHQILIQSAVFLFVAVCWFATYRRKKITTADQN